VGSKEYGAVFVWENALLWRDPLRSEEKLIRPSKILCDETAG
jgi:hypothetical protein